ncbi:MAG TPA: hypothetical protein VM938_14785 [Acidimicrobiales bacterium]|nr:hypothetical protein [Acidimicrobiales bacterium]
MVLNRTRHPIAKVVAALALGAAMLLPAAASSAPPPPHTPLITDPVGDTGYFCPSNVTIFGLQARCGREIPTSSAPSADIVQGDITLQSTSLVFDTTVVDLDDPSAHPDSATSFSMTAVTGNVSIKVNASRTFRQEPPYATLEVSNRSTFRTVTTPATAVFDNTTNTVSWTVPLTRLNESVTHVCPECRELQRGSTLTEISAATTYEDRSMVLSVGASDSAYANRPYTIGDD